MKTLAILIPSIPERAGKLKDLLDELERQRAAFERPDQIKIISLIDNRQMSIGAKRKKLIDLAYDMGATYSCIIDDDDWVTANFIYEIGCAIHNENADLFTFNQMARINNAYSIVQFGHHNPIQDFNVNAITLRPAWHCNVYRTSIAKECIFDDSNWGEDVAFSVGINNLCETSYHIPHVLHIYQHDQHLTAAK